MLNYANYLIKKIAKKRSNYIILAVCMIIITLFVMTNMELQDKFKENIESKIKQNQQDIKYYQKLLSAREEDVNDEIYITFKSAIDNALEDKASNELLINYFNQKNWDKVYETYEKILEKEEKKLSNLHAPDDAGIETVLNNNNKEQFYIKYLNQHHLDYEDMDSPIFGFTFLTHLSQMILPVIITVCCIYLLVQVFLTDDLKQFNISSLLPLGKNKVFFTRLFVGLGITLFTYVLLSFFTFLIATIVNSNSGLEYPVMIQKSGSETWYAVKSTTIFKNWFILGFLFFTNVCLFICVLSLLIKEDGALFLVGVCVILGFAYLPNLVSSLARNAHLYPTTFLNYVGVVSNSISNKYQNIKISLNTGFTVLSISMSIQLMICFLINNVKNLHKEIKLR